MAKSGAMNILEQHLEKMVLGVCVVLLGVFWLMLSSPRAVDLPGVAGAQDIRLARVDQAVLDVAKDVQRQVAEKKVETPSTDGGSALLAGKDYVGEIRLLQEDATSGISATTAFGQLARPISDSSLPEMAKVDLDELIKSMPAPQQPVVKVVRDLPNRPTGAPSDVVAAHAVTIYPWGDLMSAWRDKLGKSGVPCRLAAVGVVAQVQERQADGSWSQPREVNTVSVTTDEQGLPTDTVKVPEIPAYDGTNLAEISDIRRQIADPNSGWQTYILEPAYWQIWWPGYNWVDWLVNLPENPVTKEAAEQLAQAAEGTAPGALGATAPRPISGRPAPITVSELLRRQQMMGYSSDTTEEYEYESPDIESPGPSRYGYRNPTMMGGPAAPVVPLEEIPAPQQPVVPDISQQMSKGKVLVWFHDDSLDSQKVYRYRVAVKFLNPLLGFDNAVKNQAFAAVPSIVTQFSDWSQPVEVPQPTEFFLTGSLENQGTVTVTVFTRSTGQQVKKQFTVVPGQVIGEVKEIQLTNPADGMVAKVPVDFTTGVIAVEVGFDRFDALGRKAVEMLYLDEKGDLRSKQDVNSLSRTDKEYLKYKDLEAKERITRLAAEAAKLVPGGGTLPPSGMGM